MGTSIILAGKLGSRRSTTSFSKDDVVAEAIIKCQKFYPFACTRGLNLLQYR